MFVHKNTLQYKLKKLTELTGKDIRLPSDSAVFFMAMLFYQKLYQSSADYTGVSLLS
jgi:carbohydrate diacid regulator